MDLGFDSLMAVNLRMAAEERLGTVLPLAAIADGLSLADIAREMIAGLGTDRTDTVAVEAAAKHVGDAGGLTDTIVEEIKARAASVRSLRGGGNG